MKYECYRLFVHGGGSHFPKIVCLIGSSRFKEEFTRQGARLEKSGVLVLCMSFFQHVDGIDVSGEERKVLEGLDERRIDLADEVLVINAERTRCKRCGEWIEDDFYPGCACVVRAPFAFQNEFYERVGYVGESTRKEIAYADRMGKSVTYLVPVC